MIAVKNEAVFWRRRLVTAALIVLAITQAVQLINWKKENP